MENHFHYNHINMRHRRRLACGLIPLLNLLLDRGVDINALLLGASIKRVELFDPAFTVSFEQELRIVERGLESIVESHVSLELAGHYHLHNYSVLGLAMRCSANLAEIFDLILRYPRLVWGICETIGNVEGDLMSFEFRGGNTRAERFLLERDMASIKILCEEALQEKVALTEVWFTHAEPVNRSIYTDFFQCTVLFQQAINKLTLPLSVLERKVPTADLLAKEFYEAQCARASAEIDQPFRYTFLIRDQLFHLNPIPSLSELAERLDIDVRALQRCLKKEEASFSNILKEVRLKRATDRLKYSDLMVEQIAEELGFKDAVAFSHAFKE
jgi:AraC-like DNA-binding protein